MRNPDRIKPILRELSRLWELHPDWRLGQLIYNIAGRDTFHVEDYDLINHGFDKFGGETQPDTDDFPEYYIDPNALKQMIEDIKTGKFTLL